MKTAYLLALLPAIAALPSNSKLTKRQSDCLSSCESQGCGEIYNCIWNCSDVSTRFSTFPP
jgi:hypothetical protein